MVLEHSLCVEQHTWKIRNPCSLIPDIAVGAAWQHSEMVVYMHLAARPYRHIGVSLTVTMKIDTRSSKLAKNQWSLHLELMNWKKLAP